MAQKILVLDDEENYAQMLQSLLQQNYFLVDSATRPEQALVALQEKGYDLVISDYKMPVMDGADFLLKARQINPDLPFILVSGLMNTPELVKVANMGVTLVLEKPLDVPTFLAHVKRFVTPFAPEEYEKLAKEEQVEESSSLRTYHGEKFHRTYPGPCSYYSDISPNSQYFLQRLWIASQAYNHIFITTPVGSDVELVLRQLEDWKNGETDSIQLHEIEDLIAGENPDLGGGEDEGRSFFLGVHGYGRVSVQDQSKWVEHLAGIPEHWVVVHFVPEMAVQDLNKAVNHEIAALAEEANTLRLLPLKERLPDLAAYAVRYLDQFAGMEGIEGPYGFSEDAVALMLGYEWPGNFAELVGAIRRALLMNRSGILDSKALVNAIRRWNSEAKVPEGLKTLSEQLCREQQKFLDSLTGGSERNLKDALKSIGFESLGITASTSLAEVPLLFPELLVEGSGENA